MEGRLVGREPELAALAELVEDAGAGRGRVALVTGEAGLIGPDDPHPEVGDEALRLLLRSIFSAAGGTHDDWDSYDRTMRQERRAAVLVAPGHVYSNPI